MATVTIILKDSADGGVAMVMESNPAFPAKGKEPTSAQLMAAVAFKAITDLDTED